MFGSYLVDIMQVLRGPRLSIFPSIVEAHTCDQAGTQKAHDTGVYLLVYLYSFLNSYWITWTQQMEGKMVAQISCPSLLGFGQDRVPERSKLGEAECPSCLMEI